MAVHQKMLLINDKNIRNNVYSCLFMTIGTEIKVMNGRRTIIPRRAETKSTKVSKMFNFNILDIYFKRYETGKVSNMSKMSIRSSRNRFSAILATDVTRI